MWINARHGRGTAWARHGHGMLCVNPPLGVQNAIRMRRIVVICGLSGSTIFFTLSHKGHDFRKTKKLLNMKTVFWFYLQIFFSETFFVLRRTERDTIKNVYLSCSVPLLFLSDFNETWIFWTDFWKYCIVKFRENPYSGSQVLCGWDVHDEANSCFSQFCERAWSMSSPLASVQVSFVFSQE